MKTNSRVLALGVSLLGLAFCAGCAEEEASADVPVAAEAVPVFTLAATNAIADPNPAALVTSNSVANSTNAARMMIPTVIPDSLKLSPAMAEVIKLIQAGLSEEVVLTYITNSAEPFNLGSNEILYLNDLGASTSVITTLIQHDSSPPLMAKKQAAYAVKPLPPGVALTEPATNVYPPRSSFQSFQSAPEPEPVNPPTDDSAAVTSPAPQIAPSEAQVVDMGRPTEGVNVSYFYSSLTPYGSWVDVAGYGYCWRPTVAVCNSSWRPYAQGGRWLWTDCGWYWYSDYSWGWAPFHYGRWHCPSGLGWVWMPDTCWGPAWVSWRHTPSYCGWAPLPPSARYVSGAGFYWNSGSVGISFDFGIHPSHYVFVPLDRFCDRRPHNYCLSPRHGTIVYKDSTVINNYVSVNKNTVVNHGVGFDRIAKVTRGDVRQVKLMDTASVRDLGFRREQITPDGKTLAVVRPDASAFRHNGMVSSPRPISAMTHLQPRDAKGPANSVNANRIGGPPKLSPDERPAQPGSIFIRPSGSRVVPDVSGSATEPTARTKPTSQGGASISSVLPPERAEGIRKPKPIIITRADVPSSGTAASGVVNQKNSMPGGWSAAGPTYTANTGLPVAPNSTPNNRALTSRGDAVSQQRPPEAPHVNRPTAVPQPSGPAGPRVYVPTVPAAPQPRFVPGPPAASQVAPSAPRPTYSAPHVASPSPAPSPRAEASRPSASSGGAPSRRSDDVPAPSRGR
jgi:hypothetical protein